MFRKMLLGAWLVLFSFALLGTVAAQEEKPLFKVTVVKHDTLIGICRKVLELPKKWREVARFNSMKNPNLIYPDDIIIIPTDLLKGEPVSASLRFVRGKAEIYSEATKTWRPVTMEDKIGEGDIVRTGADSLVEYQYQDGHTVVQRPATTVQVKKARTSSVSSSYRFLLSAGSTVTRIQKATGKETRFQVETPTAIAGVRGTTFRSTVGPDGVVRFEAFDDPVEVTAELGTVEIKNGEGTLVAKGTAPTAPVKLPAAPVLIQPLAVYQRLPVRLAFEKISGAVSYRVVLARDRDFREPIEQRLINPQDNFELAGLKDGTYYLQASSLDAAGFEGLASEPVELRVRTNPAAPFTELPRDQAVYYGKDLTCKWLKVADASRYHLQIAEDAAFTRLARDTSDLTRTEYPVGDLAYNTYYFRVSAVAADNWQGLWSDTLRFELQKPLPATPFTEVPRDQAVYRGQALTCKWLKVADASRYHVQIADDAGFTKLVKESSDITANSYETGDLEFKSYYFRVSSIDVDNRQGAWSDPLRFAMQLPPPKDAPAVEAPTISKTDISIRWQDLGDGTSYRFQLAGEPEFGKVLVDQKVPASEITLEKPKKSGTYYARTAAIDRWNQEGDFSAPQSFDVKPSSNAGFWVTLTAIIFTILVP